MRKSWLIAFWLPRVLCWGWSPAGGAEQSSTSQPQFATDGKLVRPEGYRRWVYVSSGFGMSYNQSASGMQSFTNVFVAPEAYDYFTANGKCRTRPSLC